MTRNARMSNRTSPVRGRARVSAPVKARMDSTPKRSPMDMSQPHIDAVWRAVARVELCLGDINGWDFTRIFDAYEDLCRQFRYVDEEYDNAKLREQPIAKWQYICSTDPEQIAAMHN